MEAPSHVPSRRSQWAFLVAGLVALVCIAAMLTTPSSGRAWATSCKGINVVFMLYVGQTGGPPVTNGCWYFQRPINGLNTPFATCSSLNGHLYINGSNPTAFIFDDTNPQTALSTENGLISSRCNTNKGGLNQYAEFMAERSAPSWCTNQLIANPCWRFNDTGGVFAHYFAELYSAGRGYDLRGDWTSCSPYHGACYSNSRPVINIGYWANLNDYPDERAAVIWECNWTDPGQYMAIYSGVQLNSTDTTTIDNALRDCTT